MFRRMRAGFWDSEESVSKFLGLVEGVREDRRKTKWFQASGTNGTNTQQ